MVKRAKRGNFICKICQLEKPSEEKINKSTNICKTCKDRESLLKKEENEFYRYLIDDLGCDIVTGMIKSQYKKYVEQGYKVPGMRYTCFYCKDVEKLDFDFKTYGIGFIAYNYHRAQDYFMEQERLRSNANKIVKIEPIMISPNRTKKEEKRRVIYDLDDIVNSF